MFMDLRAYHRQATWPQCRLIEVQQRNAKTAKVAVLYASAYGNTASLAQAISRGITKAGVGVEMVNLEQATSEEADTILQSAQGFVIGADLLWTLLPTCPPCHGSCAC
jgi:flavorubredoxin